MKKALENCNKGQTINGERLKLEYKIRKRYNPFYVWKTYKHL